MDKDKLTDKQKELLKQCKYYKGEDVCPFGESEYDYPEYSFLISNPKAFWWFVEKEIIEHHVMSFPSMSLGVRCKIYKHMEYAPLTEKECEKSYNTAYKTSI